jgi:hypothetical protein
MWENKIEIWLLSISFLVHNTYVKWDTGKGEAFVNENKNIFPLGNKQDNELRWISL